MNKKLIITALLALVAMMGHAQVKPDTITINFQLSSKAQGEKAIIEQSFHHHAVRMLNKCKAAEIFTLL